MQEANDNKRFQLSHQTQKEVQQAIIARKEQEMHK
jgi:hypothetical protein